MLWENGYHSPLKKSIIILLCWRIEDLCKCEVPFVELVIFTVDTAVKHAYKPKQYIYTDNYQHTCTYSDDFFIRFVHAFSYTEEKTLAHNFKILLKVENTETHNNKMGLVSVHITSGCCRLLQSRFKSSALIIQINLHIYECLHVNTEYILEKNQFILEV